MDETMQAPKRIISRSPPNPISEEGVHKRPRVAGSSEASWKDPYLQVLQKAEPGSFSEHHVLDICAWWREVWHASSSETLLQPLELPPSRLWSAEQVDLQTFPVPPVLEVVGTRCVCLPEYSELWNDIVNWLDPSLRTTSFTASQRLSSLRTPWDTQAAPRVGRARRYPVEASPSAFLILGSPGIGKSISLLYILYRRMCARLPTICRFGALTLYFCEDGVFFLRNRRVYDLPDRDGDQRVLLFDSAGEDTSPSLPWIQSYVPIIEAAFPRYPRLEWSEKLPQRAVRWWMRPPCVSHVIAVIYNNYPSVAQEAVAISVIDDYVNWGPSIRDIQHSVTELHNSESPSELLEDGDSTHSLSRLELVEASLARTGPTMRRLQDLLGSDLKHTRLLADVTSLQLSQRVLVFTCGTTRADAVAMVISRTVYEQLREEYAAEWVSTLQEVGDLLLQTGRLRTTAGYFIEDLLHAALTSHGQCFPAYDLSSRVPTSASSGAVFHVSTQSDKFLSFGDKSIQICSAKTVPNTALALAIFVKHDRTAALPRYVYLRPKAANNATFDACVLLDDGVIWLLQYSVSREHNISAVGLDWIKKHYSKQHRANWTVNYVYFSTAMPAEVELPVSNEVSNAITAAFFVQVHHKPLVKAYSPHYLQKLREFAEDE